MLLTDGNPNNDEDLRVYESAILDVAHAETIDLEPKLKLATEEIAQEVLDFLLDHRGADPHAAERRGIGAGDVVITRQIKRWHAVHTLEIVYRDAFNNQLNDRYQAKFREYRELTRNARAHSFRFGVGLALAPVPQASPPIFSVAEGFLPETTYYARAAWVSAGAGGQAGQPSELAAFDAPPGSLPVLQMTDPPAGATGFNVYLGLTPVSLALQNQTPVPVGQSFTLPGSGLTPGVRPGDGQAADLFISGYWMLRRG